MHRVVLAVAVLAFSLSLSAQDLEAIAGVRMQLETPGARGAAMGGTSAALSDSFSAAANPAALAKQQKRTAALELRRTTADMQFTTGGTIGSFTTSSLENGTNGVRSAVLVVPSRRATWAVYYDEPMHATMNSTSVPRGEDLITIGIRGSELVPFDDCHPPTGIGSDCWFSTFSAPGILPSRGELRLRRYGAAAATSFGRASFGGALQYAQLTESFTSAVSSQDVNEGRVTWSAGTQLDLTPRVRLGASYQSGASYDAHRRLEIPTSRSLDTSLRTPSSYKAGIAADLTPRLTFAADAVRVNYSEMKQKWEVDGIESPVAGFIFYEAPDVTELHAGLEYRLGAVALRGGWWHDPAHRARAISTNDQAFADTINVVMLRDADENHVTAGIGFGERVRFDAAVDRSENTTRASVAVSSTF